MPWGGGYYIVQKRNNNYSNPIEDKLNYIYLGIDKAGALLSQSIIEFAMLRKLITELEAKKIILDQLPTTGEYAQQVDLYKMKMDVLTDYALKLSTQLAERKPPSEEKKHEKLATVSRVTQRVEELKTSKRLQATRTEVLGASFGPMITIALYLTVRDRASAASVNKFFCAFFYKMPLNEPFISLSSRHGLFFNLEHMKDKPTLRKFNRELKGALNSYLFTGGELPKTLLQFANAKAPKKLM